MFAEAYGKDPDFFAFYRSMQAYETGLKSNDTRFLLRPDSDFFRYLRRSVRQAAGDAAARSAEAVSSCRPTVRSKRHRFACSSKNIQREVAIR